MLWLFDPASTGSANEWDSKGITATEAITAIANALDKLVDPNTTLRGITEIEDQARKLQKTMTGGMVLESGKFREHPDMSSKAVFYCDSDVLFTEKFDIQQFIDCVINAGLLSAPNTPDEE